MKQISLAKMRRMSLADGLRERFEELAWQLSPENLSCDGESSLEMTLFRRGNIMREWAELEHEAGRKVSEGEIYDNTRRQ